MKLTLDHESYFRNYTILWTMRAIFVIIQYFNGGIRNDHMRICAPRTYILIIFCFDLARV